MENSPYLYREWSVRWRKNRAIISRHKTQREAVEVMRRNPDSFVFNEEYKFDILAANLGIRWDTEDEEVKEIFGKRD
jgi:hypothetical protein